MRVDFIKSNTIPYFTFANIKPKDIFLLNLIVDKYFYDSNFKILEIGSNCIIYLSGNMHDPCKWVHGSAS